MSPEPATETSTRSAIRTFLFTDIEGSTRLWEQEPARMRAAMARHDELSRKAVLGAGGQIVKTTGDGVHAVFADAVQALHAALTLQQAMAAPAPEDGIALKLRCGVHCGECEARDGDFYGPVLNRAARVMSASHGGQTLVTQAVAERVAERLPPAAALLDLGTVRLRDLASAERVYQLLHPALRTQFPPLRSLEATPNNLVQQLNSFVGRERELAEVRALLSKTRLLTLLGMGGIGKSRLSVQLGAELLDEYPDGVWLVELAPLADPLLVPQALATVLGVKEDRGAGITDALLGHVRDKTLLVILDNCEHVVHACADLAKRLLQAGPGVRVLTSSRDVLQVAGETVYQVPTLGVPAADEEGEDTVPPRRLGSMGSEGRGASHPARPGLVNELARHEAVRLFLDRARAVQPSLQLDADNAAAVASICRRLDGIPLALELAAARARVLSVQAIAERLKDRFRLLVTGDQTVLPRQRTLRALIDWSFELLSDTERVMFGRLSVFAGGWTLESAEAVCAGGGLEAEDVLDLLAQLVQKSLVVMDRDGQRYRMLETVRAYAAEKLAEAGDEDATRGMHVAHFVAAAEEARGKLAGPEQAKWLSLLDLERENLLGAHAWCGKAPACLEQGLRLVFALRPYWLNRGLLNLGYRLTVEALDRRGTKGRDLTRFRALADAGWLAYFLGRYGESREYLQEALAIAGEIGRRDLAAVALQPLGMACLGRGDVPAAREYLEAAVVLAREHGDKREIAAALNALAQLHRTQGAPEAAEPLYEMALPLARELGNAEYEAAFLLNLTMVSMTRRPNDAVRAMLKQVLEIAEELGSRPVEQSTLDVCAALAASERDWSTAARFYGMAEAMARQTGMQRDPADDAFLKPYVASAREALGQMRFEEAASTTDGQEPRQFVAEARSWLTNR